MVRGELRRPWLVLGWVTTSELYTERCERVSFCRFEPKTVIGSP